jgi:hypothetical protein
MAVSGLTANVRSTVQINLSAGGPVSSQPYSPSVNGTALTAGTSYSIGTDEAGRANAGVMGILTIAAGGSATLNLQNLFDLLGNPVSLVRLKAFRFRLLSTSDDAVAGTACGGVTIGNAPANANALELGSPASVRTLPNGGESLYRDPGAGGIAVSASACNVLFTNNDGANAAAVGYELIGATA